MPDEDEEQAAAVTKVSIDTPPLSVSCEAPGALLEDVAAQALKLYREVFTPDMSKPGSGLGFVLERDVDGQAE